MFRLEGELLEEHGQEILSYTEHNERLEDMTALEKVATTLWSRQSHREISDLLQHERPDIMHVHNTFPLISPSIYHAAAVVGVPVVQTLHNYRLLCPQSDFLRDGKVCEDCLGKQVPWPGVVHSCYRNSRVASAGTAGMLALHRALGTYDEKISAYIALTEFGRQKFIEGGLPAEKIFVKPNFVHPDPGAGEGKGQYALFVGRLSNAKGVQVMLRAWQNADDLMPLKIVGDGPLGPLVKQTTAGLRATEWLGHVPRAVVLDLMRRASILVFPSVWYEGFPLVIVEAFATGLPVVASNLGAMSSIIENESTGLHFEAGDHRGLADTVRWVASNPAELDKMRRKARREFERRYTASINYEELMNIYRQARGEV